VVKLNPLECRLDFDLKYRFLRCTIQFAAVSHLRQQDFYSDCWLSLKTGSFNKKALVSATNALQLGHSERLGFISKCLVDSRGFAAPAIVATSASDCKSFR